MNKAIKIKCPICKKSIDYDFQSPFRPFCSQSCKNQDLIHWHDEDYKAPGKEATSEELSEAIKENEKDK